MTWTPKTQQAETWTSESAGLHVFSTLVFSHAFHNGKRVFALGNPNGGVEIWDDVRSADAEVWTPA